MSTKYLGIENALCDLEGMALEALALQEHKGLYSPHLGQQWQRALEDIAKFARQLVDEIDGYEGED